jgi:DNA (cytosine-5)-methyltransferase 1
MGKNINLIDLFCGCGGFSRGFKDAGFNVMMGIDVWKDATITYQKNFPNAKVLEEDLSKIDGEKILSILKCKREDIDVIIGGPPCQGFSVSGKRLIDDPRNELYKSFVRIVEYIKPKVFVMENVPGLVKLFDGKVKDEVISDFTSVGYNVTLQTLLACDYGVPQSRKRVFFIGVNNESSLRKDCYFEFPNPTHGEGRTYSYVTSKAAIDDLPLLNDNIMGDEPTSYISSPRNSFQEIMRKNSLEVFNHLATVHKQQTREIIALVPDGGNYKDLPEELWGTRKVNIAWTRMNSQKPCFTIDTGHNHHFHYFANRVPTCRESARIQSFPDDFIFYGTKTSQLKQVGNAVPPMLAQAIARKIKELLE